MDVLGSKDAEQADSGAGGPSLPGKAWWTEEM